MTELNDIVQALSVPSAYPEPAVKVDIAQTHVSFVFIAGDFVFKIKKPVDMGFLDFTTLEKRRFFCEQEVALNRRLSPDVYLGVVPITRENGIIKLGGTGTPVEYAVKMKRLPQDRMMDVLLPQHKVTPVMIKAVAARVADFHRKAATGKEIAACGTIDTIRFNWEENFSQTEKYIGRAVNTAQFRNISTWVRNFIQDKAPLLQKRVQDNRIRDCHGDLHTQHICFTDGIVIYDCIEFNNRFRYIDVAAEVSFLAMDLDRSGYTDLAKQFIDAYIRFSADKEIAQLLNFYKCYYAYVRAKVTAFRLDDNMHSAAQKQSALEEAKKYFKLSESYIAGHS